MNKRAKTSELKKLGQVRLHSRSNLTAGEFRQLMYLCVDFLDLCSRVSGTIDPAAASAWLVARAQEDITIHEFKY